MLVAVAVGIWVVAGYFAVQGPRSLLAQGTADVPPQPLASELTPSSAVPLASSLAPAVSPPSATKAAPSATAQPMDTSACVAAIFSPGTFRKKPNFEFLCTQTNPRIGGLDVRARVVLGASGNVTDGMREWAGLGWYEMAAYGLLRARCCSSSPPLKWTFDLVCPVDESLARLQKAVAARDQAAIQEAVKDYTKQVICLSKFGQAENFGQTASPGAGITAFNVLLGRAMGGSKGAAK
ncbi:MAG: hypothetical protein DRI90_05360 [Deltaproteobacteria bacterium]|nr:MAG: hypothetical protein DRI90_05360 [Deltaproteobacteria bacterium]